MRKVIIALGVIVIIIAWYLFRPEKLFINKSVNEGLPSASTEQANSPRILTKGNFHGVAHETKGTAAIYQLRDGKRVLRLTNFETSNGPDVHIFLGAAQDANDSDTVTTAGYIELGSLKGNVGDQNYEIPLEIDLGRYHSVTIWCKRFGVNFGTAPLTTASASDSGPVGIYQGSFHGVAHETKGTAAIYELPDGNRVLRLTNFETSNGPDMHVFLGAAQDANDTDTVTTAGYIELGSLKGNVGDQNYDIPLEIDLGKYHSVTIWCKRFGVNFGTAPLIASK